ncbi:MAG: hypothetical protein JO002_08505 [Burkholderiaceae bacterium]|nr:hypothetical protein [Burkholderiaceae bacterium]
MQIAIRFVTLAALIASLSACKSKSDNAAPDNCWSDYAQSRLNFVDSRINAAALIGVTSGKKMDLPDIPDADIEKTLNIVKTEISNFHQISYDQASDVHVCGADATITYNLPRRTLTLGPFPIEFKLYPSEDNGYHLKISKTAPEQGKGLFTEPTR